MKTTVVLTLIAMIGMVSLALRKPEIESKEKIGTAVITALQRGSANEFGLLFPTFTDFQGLMLKNAEMYGKNIEEASRDFQTQYETVLSPAFGNCFKRIREEGARAGIDWRSAKLVSVDVPEKVLYEYAVVPMTINFESSGKHYRLVFEKVFVMNGQWKISHHVNIVK
jgi:hypothetical protein